MDIFPLDSTYGIGQIYLNKKSTTFNDTFTPNISLFHRI